MEGHSVTRAKVTSALRLAAQSLGKLCPSPSLSHTSFGGLVQRQLDSRRIHNFPYNCFEDEYRIVCRDGVNDGASDPTGSCTIVSLCG